MSDFSWLDRMEAGTPHGFAGPAVHTINGAPYVVTVTPAMVVAVEGEHGYPKASPGDARRLAEALPLLRPLARATPIDLDALRAFIVDEGETKEAIWFRGDAYDPVRLGRFTYDRLILRPLL